jgi:hypothetical protein
MSDKVHSTKPIEPLDLAMLQRVLDGTCSTHSFPKESCEAREAAALLITLFNHGIRQEQHLAAMVR